MGQKLSEKHLIEKLSPQEKKSTAPHLNDDHLLPSKVKRYKRGHTFLERAHAEMFNRVDDILDEVFVDVCNGVSRSDITQKLMNGVYEHQKKGITYRQAQEYWNTALDRMHYNTDIEHARLKDLFYNRYESLLETAIRKDDIYNAKGILDSMAKIFLGLDSKQNNIQINNNSDGIVIKFGFADEGEQDNVQPQED